MEPFCITMACHLLLSRPGNGHARKVGDYTVIQNPAGSVICKDFDCYQEKPFKAWSTDSSGDTGTITSSLDGPPT